MTSTAAPRTWSETFHVRSYETDPTGTASLPAICNYLQEIAGNHAGALGVSVEHLTDQNLTWVLTRLHVEMDRYPAWRDDLHIETWPSGENGLYATREFLLTDVDGQPLGRATSAWLLIDLARRRPVRIPAFVSEIRLPHRTRPLPDDFPRLPAPAEADHTHQVTVRYGDVDMNRHTNNVRYVTWAVDALPQEVLERQRIAALEVHFRAETVYGDALLVETAATDDETPAYLHRITRPDDGREVALARTRLAARG